MTDTIIRAWFVFSYAFSPGLSKRREKAEAELLKLTYNMRKSVIQVDNCDGIHGNLTTG